jgi:uncharacterized protein with NRDE domain
VCLAAFALGQSEHFPFVLASNRDEFFERGATPMEWWPDACPAILAGRDLDAGGTWLGLSDTGRLALLTNIRNPTDHRVTAASRGSLVPAWLASQEPFEAFWARHDPSRFNGFNLLAFDFGQVEQATSPAAWFASSPQPQPHALAPGLHGLSNAALDTPWPKVVALKQALAQALDSRPNADALAEQLFAALADTRVAPDDQLPSTGVTLEAERALSAARVKLFDGRYGTRCSTLVICERQPDGVTTTVLERSFHPGTTEIAQTTQVSHTLAGWPLALQRA